MLNEKIINKLDKIELQENHTHIFNYIKENEHIIVCNKCHYINHFKGVFDEKLTSIVKCDHCHKLIYINLPYINNFYGNTYTSDLIPAKSPKRYKELLKDTDDELLFEKYTCVGFILKKDTASPFHLEPVFDVVSLRLDKKEKFLSRTMNGKTIDIPKALTNSAEIQYFNYKVISKLNKEFIVLLANHMVSELPVLDQMLDMNVISRSNINDVLVKKDIESCLYLYMYPMFLNEVLDSYKETHELYIPLIKNYVYSCSEDLQAIMKRYEHMRDFISNQYHDTRVINYVYDYIKELNDDLKCSKSFLLPSVEPEKIANVKIIAMLINGCYLTPILTCFNDEEVVEICSQFFNKDVNMKYIFPFMQTRFLNDALKENENDKVRWFMRTDTMSILKQANSLYTNKGVKDLLKRVFYTSLRNTAEQYKLNASHYAPSYMYNLAETKDLETLVLMYSVFILHLPQYIAYMSDDKLNVLKEKLIKYNTTIYNIYCEVIDILVSDIDDSFVIGDARFLKFTKESYLYNLLSISRTEIISTALVEFLYVSVGNYFKLFQRYNGRYIETRTQITEKVVNDSTKRIEQAMLTLNLLTNE